MAPHQERVVSEKEELDDKIAKLAAFIGVSTYAKLPTAEQDRLERQIGAMTIYSNILRERIAHPAPALPTGER